MQSLTFITDETHNKRYVQIDLDEIKSVNNEQLEEMIDVIIAEARKDEEKTSIDELEMQLKAEGRL